MPSKKSGKARTVLSSFKNTFGKGRLTKHARRPIPDPYHNLKDEGAADQKSDDDDGLERAKKNGNALSSYQKDDEPTEPKVKKKAEIGRPQQSVSDVDNGSLAYFDDTGPPCSGTLIHMTIPEEDAVQQTAVVAGDHQQPDLRAHITTPTPISYTAQTTITWKNDPSWRDRSTQRNQDRYLCYRTIFTEGTKRSNKSRYSHTPGYKTSNGVMLVDMAPGTIIWHWDDRKCNDRNLPDTARGVYYDGTQRKLRKGRYWLVIEADLDMIKECPIYTNNNQGLAKKPKRFWNEYFSVRPKHIPPSGFKNQVPDHNVLGVAWMKMDDKELEGKLVRETMVVHWTEVHERPIDIPQVRLVGQLHPESTKELCEKVAISEVAVIRPE